MSASHKTRSASVGLRRNRRDRPRTGPRSPGTAYNLLHHELGELSVAENGNFIALSTEMRTYPNYPANENDPSQTTTSANVVGDVVVEFRPSDGALVREFKFLDVLDVPDAKKLG